MKKEVIDYLNRSPVTKCVGSFTHGFVGISSRFNANKISDGLTGLVDDTEDIPQWNPHVDDLSNQYFGECSFNLGMFAAIGIEVAGIYYTIESLQQGRYARALVYPLAKIVTNGTAALIDSYRKRLKPKY